MSDKKKAKRAHEIKMLTKYYEGVSKDELLKEFKTTSAKFDYINSKYDIDITFDEKAFFEILKHDYSTLDRKEFINKYGGNDHNYYALAKQLSTYTRRVVVLDAMVKNYTVVSNGQDVIIQKEEK